MKKRYFVIAAAILLILMSAGLLPEWAKPVRPFIQLPGEVYPGTDKTGLFSSDLFKGFTNTFMSTIIVWIMLTLLALFLRAGSRSPDEVPSGFYNFVEMVIEGAYNFAENIAGPKKVKDFFPLFMTFILMILTANWLGLVPGVDSVGIWENKPHFKALKDMKVIDKEVKALGTAYKEAPNDIAKSNAREALDGYLAGLVVTHELDHSLDLDDTSKALTADSHKELEHAIEHEYNLDNSADFREGLFLLRGRKSEVVNPETGLVEQVNDDNNDWTIVPFLRPAATDLNFTLAFAIVAMVMVQYFGIRYLGAREYFAKFFPFIGEGFGAAVAKSPMRAIDPLVGILELVSEISKVISFAFRLLGNIFAGMVLLFVMSFLLPAANMAFFLLEFFVGLIQAVVFGLLMLIFMVSATESHGHGDHDDHH